MISVEVGDIPMELGNRTPLVELGWLRRSWIREDDLTPLEEAFLH